MGEGVWDEGEEGEGMWMGGGVLKEGREERWLKQNDKCHVQLHNDTGQHSQHSQHKFSEGLSFSLKVIISHCPSHFQIVLFVDSIFHYGDFENQLMNINCIGLARVR